MRSEDGGDATYPPPGRNNSIGRGLLLLIAGGHVADSIATVIHPCATPPCVPPIIPIFFFFILTYRLCHVYTACHLV